MLDKRLTVCCCLTSIFPALAQTSRLYSQSYTPEHPKVVQMVDRGVAFLETLGGRARVIRRGTHAGGLYDPQGHR